MAHLIDYDNARLLIETGGARSVYGQHVPGGYLVILRTGVGDKVLQRSNAYPPEPRIIRSGEGLLSTFRKLGVRHAEIDLGMPVPRGQKDIF